MTPATPAQGNWPSQPCRGDGTQGRAGRSFSGGAASESEDLLDPPGRFAINYPLMTVMGFFTLDVLFGVIVSTLYGALA